MKEFNLRPHDSVMIGDQLSDVYAGIKSGFKLNFLVSSKNVFFNDKKFLVIKNIDEIKKFLQN